MSDTATASLEQDIVALRKEIEQTDQQASQAREDADKMREDMKASGTNPLTDADAFGKVDEKYRAASELAQQSQQLHARLEQVLASWRGAAPRGGDGGAAPGTVGAGSRSPLTIASSVGTRALVERFFTSQGYQQLLDSGRLTETGGSIGATGPIQVATAQEARDLFLAYSPHGALVPEDQQLTPPVGLPQRPIRVMDLITVLTTGAEIVEWAEQVVRTTAAAETAYGTAAPRSTYTWERRTSPVRRIPHEAVGTRGNLADQGQLEGLLRTELINGLERYVEQQVVRGDGVGEALLGINNTTGIGAIARDTVGGETRLEAIHRAITWVLIALEEWPTAIGVHPQTNEEITFEKDSQGRYLLNPDPSRAGANTIWGLPKVVSTVFTPGEVTVGAWHWNRFWLRQGVSVNAYDQHEDFASKGLVLFLAETRGANRLVQPKAFAGVTL